MNPETGDALPVLGEGFADAGISPLSLEHTDGQVPVEGTGYAMSEDAAADPLATAGLLDVPAPAIAGEDAGAPPEVSSVEVADDTMTGTMLTVDEASASPTTQTAVDQAASLPLDAADSYEGEATSADPTGAEPEVPDAFELAAEAVEVILSPIQAVLGVESDTAHTEASVDADADAGLDAPTADAEEHIEDQDAGSQDDDGDDDDGDDDQDAKQNNGRRGAYRGRGWRSAQANPTGNWLNGLLAQTGASR